MWVFTVWKKIICIENIHWVLVYTVCDFQHFLTYCVGSGSSFWVVSPQENKMEAKEEFLFFIAVNDG